MEPKTVNVLGYALREPNMEDIVGLGEDPGAPETVRFLNGLVTNGKEITMRTPVRVVKAIEEAVTRLMGERP